MTPKRRVLRLPLFAAIATIACATSLGAGEPVGIVPDSLKVSVAAKATMHSFTAEVTGGELAITVDPATATIDSAVFSFEWNGVKTGKDDRDHEMLEWVGAAEHPKGTFTLKSIETQGAGTVAKGTLELFGRGRDIEFPVSLSREGAGFKVSGSATLDHRDWGLKQFRKLGLLTVNPTVVVRFQFETTGPN